METAINSFKDLIVWQKAMDLVDAVYDLTEIFPKQEKYRLIDQMQRAVVSIPSNIAEGNRRSSRKEYCRFLRISYSSGAELETQLEIAIRRKYGTEEAILLAKNLLDEVMRMLNKMIQIFGN